MKTAAMLSAAELRALAREFRTPRSLAESLLAAGIAYELAERDREDPMAIVESLEAELEDMTRMRDESIAFNVELQGTIKDLRKELAANGPKPAIIATLAGLDQRISQAIA